jgi:hypothetical protein
MKKRQNPHQPPPRKPSPANSLSSKLPQQGHRPSPNTLINTFKGKTSDEYD